MPEKLLAWTENPYGLWIAEFQGLRFLVYQVESRWCADVIQEREAISQFRGFRDQEEATVALGLYAAGWLQGQESAEDF